MPNPRVVVWTTADPERTSAELSRRAARPRLLVPVPHGTFVLGPEPYTAETLIDGLRVVKGRRIGLMWTESTAWLVYFDGEVRGWRFGPDDSFEPAPPRRLPEGLGWLGEAAETVRRQGVHDGIGALCTALEAAGYFLDAQALVRVDGGEVDDALPHHEKKWWESLVGERQGMADTPWVDPRPSFAGTAAVAFLLVFLLVANDVPVQITVPVCALLVCALAWSGAVCAVVWSRRRRTDAFPVRDVLGMSAWAREADQE
ncbi:hypothetical protein [Lentzea sp. NBRC 102530]|uniref:hypothetical protein n=1 Tax=Lentzea sp. NBRC 102530 TaxID=3032201 RepID=UPI0024A448F2|nr:hypothetical protein [Lentzea sp. NBRC 102530]GLY49464.1 hypothetical protein Lesp01_31200 [Lentzea sp. NBRC 102530]